MGRPQPHRHPPSNGGRLIKPHAAGYARGSSGRAVCPAPTAPGTHLLMEDPGGRRPCGGPATSLAGLPRYRRSPGRAVSPFGLGLLSATAGKLHGGLRAWLASSRYRAAGLRLRPARCKVTLQRVFKYIGGGLALPPRAPRGSRGLRVARPSLPRRGGPVPAPRGARGAPGPLLASPARYARALAWPLGQGRAVAGYARHFFSATAVPAAAWPRVSIGSDADIFSTGEGVRPAGRYARTPSPVENIALADTVRRAARRTHPTASLAGALA